MAHSMSSSYSVVGQLQILTCASMVIASYGYPQENLHLPPAAAVPAVESKPGKWKSSPRKIITDIEKFKANKGGDPRETLYLPPAAAVPAVESKPDKWKSLAEIITDIEESKANKGMGVTAPIFYGAGPKFGPSQLMGYGLGYGGLAGLGGFGYGGYGGGFGGYGGGFAGGKYGSYGSFKQDPQFMNHGPYGQGGYGGGFGGPGIEPSHGAFGHGHGHGQGPWA